MKVLLLTILVSLGLAAGFVSFFLYLYRTQSGDAMRDSLMPLDEDQVGNPSKSEVNN